MSVPLLVEVVDFLVFVDDEGASLPVASDLSVPVAGSSRVLVLARRGRVRRASRERGDQRGGDQFRCHASIMPWGRDPVKAVACDLDHIRSTLTFHTIGECSPKRGQAWRLMLAYGAVPARRRSEHGTKERGRRFDARPSGSVEGVDEFGDGVLSAFPAGRFVDFATFALVGVEGGVDCGANLGVGRSGESRGVRCRCHALILPPPQRPVKALQCDEDHNLTPWLSPSSVIRRLRRSRCEVVC